MKKFKPIKGVNSRKRAEKFLKTNYFDYNSFEIVLDYDQYEKICPMTMQECKSFKCAAWIHAEVFLSNRGRMHMKDSIYDIRPGRCNSPLITGKLELKK